MYRSPILINMQRRASNCFSYVRVFLLLHPFCFSMFFLCILSDFACAHSIYILYSLFLSVLSLFFLRVFFLIDFFSSYLFIAYQPSRWWFELLEMANKLLLTGLISFFTSATSQMIIALTWAGFFVIIQLLLHPHSLWARLCVFCISDDCLYVYICSCCVPDIGEVWVL